MAEHSLDLLGLPLVDGLPNEEHGYEFAVYGDETRFGVATSAQEIVTSLLADGDLVRVTRFGNREVSFPVEITGPSLASLAHGEAALRAVIGRSGDLVWQPPDALAVPTAFDVITSSMEFRFDDLLELRKRRVFMVTLTCLPFGRSLSPVTVPALTAGVTPTTVTVNTADSTTGWSAPTAGSVTFGATGGYVYQQLGGAAPAASFEYRLNYSPAPSLAATRFVIVEWLTTGPTDPNYTSPPTLDGVGAPIANAAMGDGWVMSTYDAAGTSLTAFTWRVSRSPFTGSFRIRDVKRSNVLPGATPRQLTRVIEVGGTERTPGSIHVQTASGTGSLGQVIVHTCPEDGSGYSPPLRRWRVSGNGTPTPAADAMSGAYEPIHPNPFRAEVPNGSLPAGGYIVAARMATDTPGIHRIAWSTSTIAPLGEMNLVGGIEDIQFFNANQWVIVPLAVVTLPTTASTGTNVKTRVDIQRYSGTALINVDEAWLFREDEDCGLTVVGTSLSQLWLDSPSATSPVPKVWVGDGSATRVHPSSGLAAMGTHVLSPEGTAVFTAAVSDNPATDATFYRRWHTNAAS